MLSVYLKMNKYDQLDVVKESIHGGSICCIWQQARKGEVDWESGGCIHE